MLSDDTPVLVHFPDETDDRLLYPGTILEVSHNSDSHTAELDDEDVFPQPGQEIAIYYESQQMFTKQTAQIEAVMQTGDKPVIAFTTVGEPDSAENRQCFRVSTANNDLAAIIGTESCRVLDVSVSGLSVIAEAKHTTGANIRVTIEFEEESFSGPARVHSKRDMSPGRTRFGLQCVDDKFTDGDLQKGLQHIMMTVQRQQLRRLKRSG